MTYCLRLGKDRMKRTGTSTLSMNENKLQVSKNISDLSNVANLAVAMPIKMTLLPAIPSPIEIFINALSSSLGRCGFLINNKIKLMIRIIINETLPTP